MRHGPDGTYVHTINLSDTVAPWLNAEELPFASGNDDELGLTFVVGWVPAGATQVKVGPAYPLSAATEATIVRSTVSASGDWLPANLYLAVVPMVFDHSTIVVVVTLPDRSITKIDNLPPTSSPR
jgi:hypothetical protein